MNKSTITLLSDFGYDDHYVASMKGAILAITSEVNLVDVTHNIPPQDIEAAAYMLNQYWGDFPQGTIHLCVVDPGVGGERKPIAVAFDGRVYVGPDNGIMTPLVQKSHRWKARHLDNEGFYASNPSSTFHGRDIFAPVAGHLAAGAEFDELGSKLLDIEMLDSQPVLMGSSSIQGRIIHVDRFGNLITNIRKQHLQWAELSLQECGFSAGGQIIAEYVRTYGEAGTDPVFLFGSNGYLEIAVRNGSAARGLNLGRGTEVVLMRKNKLLSV